MDSEGKLAGIFTDGDLRRLLEGEDRSVLDHPVNQHMGRNPKILSPLQLVEEAHHLLRQYRIDQAPVVDDEQRPVGLIDVQDILDVEV